MLGYFYFGGVLRRHLGALGTVVVDRGDLPQLDELIVVELTDHDSSQFHPNGHG